jgi:hypothetical protein
MSPRGACFLALRAALAFGGPACSPVSSRDFFCSGVTWEASLPLEAPALDAAARSDYELALGKLQRLGGPASFPQCLESWKALQCASKFQKCSLEMPTQKVCPATQPSTNRSRLRCHPFPVWASPSPFHPRTQVCRSLCVQFAQACNGSQAVMCAPPPLRTHAVAPICPSHLISRRCGRLTQLVRSARCTDEMLYDEPPCTDYAELPAHGAPARSPRTITSSPAELLQTAAGLPLLLTLVVLVLHAACCAFQLSCAGCRDDDDGASPREALHDTLSRGGQRPDKAPLLSVPPR